MKKKTPWGWSYGFIIKDGIMYLHEIFGEESPDSWTVDPITISGENEKDVKFALTMALKDLDRGMIFKIRKNKLIKIK